MSAALTGPLLEAQAIRQLLASGRLLARQRVGRHPPADGRAGQRPGRALGSGMDYAESRRYQPGDAPRHIHWRASARSQDLQVRVFHRELSTEAWLLIDRRAAMRFGTQRRLKLAQGLRAALMIGALEAAADAQIATLVLEDGLRFSPPLAPVAGLRCLIHVANQSAPPLEPKREPSRALDDLLARACRSRAGSRRLYLFTDLAGFTDQRLLRGLARCTELTVVHVFDPHEREATVLDPLRAAWGTATQTLLPGSQPPNGVRAWDSALAQCAEEVRASGGRFVSLCTDQDDLSRALSKVLGK